VHEVIHAEETGQVLGITPAAVEPGQMPEVTCADEVGGDPTMVMEMEVEVELVTCPPIECRLGGTSVEHPQNYLLKVLTRPSSSSLLLSIELGRYHLGQL
jgi:hypothetical protein